MDRSELVQKAWKELEVPAPRRLKLRSPSECTGLWGRVSLITAAFLLLVFVCCTISIIPAFAGYFGSAAKGRVTHLRTAITNGRMGSDTHYLVNLVYQNGREEEGVETAVDSWVYKDLHTGDEIAIHYFSLFPSLITVDRDEDVPLGLLAILVGLVVIWILAGMGLIPKRLLIHGKAVKGRVDSFGESRMEVQFELKGEKYSTVAPRDYYGGNKDGDEVVVVYNPGNPDDNRVYDSSHCWWEPVNRLF